MREAAWLLSLLILFVLNSLQVVTKGFRGASLAQLADIEVGAAVVLFKVLYQRSSAFVEV